MGLKQWQGRKIALIFKPRYNEDMANNDFNPLYPSNEEISDFEASVREAELYDDTMKLEKEWKKKKGLLEEEEDELKDLFL